MENSRTAIKMMKRWVSIFIFNFFFLFSFPLKRAAKNVIGHKFLTSACSYRTANRFKRRLTKAWFHRWLVQSSARLVSFLPFPFSRHQRSYKLLHLHTSDLFHYRFLPSKHIYWTLRSLPPLFANLDLGNKVQKSQLTTQIPGTCCFLQTNSPSKHTTNTQTFCLIELLS